MSGQKFFAGAYHPAGPTLQAFHDSNAATRGLMGPFAGGKTRCAIEECKIRSAMQDPSPVDGIRRARGAIFRRTYNDLSGATIPDWFEEGFPQEAPGVKFSSGGTTAPSRHDILVSMPDGTILKLRVDFLAVQEHNVEAVLKSKQYTWAWGEEGTDLPQEWFLNIGGRTGRYPPPRHGGPTWAGFWMTYNAPDEDHHLYGLHMNAPYTKEKLREMYGRALTDEDIDNMAKLGVEFFEQPSGLSPQAENLHNLHGGRGYYLKQLVGKPKWWINRMIHNRFGMSRLGEPVFQDYSDEKHLAPSQLGYNSSLPLYCGLDAGRTPAAVFVQKDSSGALIVVGEVTFTGTARPFARAVRAFMLDQFGTLECEQWVHDPTASTARNDTDDDTWADVFADEMELDPDEISPAETNLLEPRLGVVENLLCAPRVSGGLEAFCLVAENCPVLRRGFNSGYHWVVQPQTGYVNRSEPNKKHPSSHPMDALEYVLMYVVGLPQILRQRALKQSKRQARQNMAGAEVYNGTGM